MSEKKFVKKLRTFGMSMKVPLTAIIIGAALIPLFLEAGIMLGTFRQRYRTSVLYSAIR